MEKLTLVTGASSNHFDCLRHLLYSIRVYESESATIVYDLGLESHERLELEKKGHEVRCFPFAAYPPHLDIRINSGEYAWKPVIVADLLREKGLVLWLDAGNLVRAKLDRIRALLAESGLYSPISAGTIQQWTHPATLQRLQAEPWLLGRRNRAGGLAGFNAKRPGITELVERWKSCALDRSCIAPPGSNRTNHRQDQAVLSVLMYQFQQKHEIKLVDELLDVSTHNDGLSDRQVRKLVGSASPRTVFGLKAIQSIMEKARHFLRS